MKENQRVRLTKKLLQDSLVKLLASKSIHKISVREICDNAEINRTTFYKYYISQYDLLKEMEEQVLSQIDGFLSADRDRPDYDMQIISQIATYLQDNVALCKLLINNTVNSEFMERLFRLPMIRRLLDEQLGKDNEAELEYAYQFVVNGGFSIIKTWINKAERESPDRIAAILVDMVYKAGVSPK